MAKPNQTEQWTKRWHDILDRELGPDPTAAGMAAIKISGFTSPPGGSNIQL